jgi:hypothetical protein
MTSWGISSRARQRTALVLAAVLTVALAISLGNVAESSASGSQAVAAKKKCKKKGKKSAVAAKKKCKKKKQLVPVVVPSPAPLVRGAINWSAVEDLDLHAYDASGAHSGYQGGVILQGIPNSTHSPDVQSGGAETFTDNVFVQGGTANREFAYVVCFYGTASATFTGVTSSGVSSSLALDGVNNDAVLLTTPGGPSGPSTNPC